ncbi:MAG TPA: hypothetical protein VLJ88_08355 [Propionibacteriaceae bacterium]|nr:hypothetical protein [Propionibacteriaceae bacterium]
MTTTDASTGSVPEASAEHVSPTDVGRRGLTDRQARILLRLLRVAYPHPRFPDAPYERTAKTIEDAGRTDDVLVTGLDDLDARADGDFVGLDDERATTLLKDVAETPFFALVHSTAVVALYDDHEVWDLLGYEGPSFDKGGYLHRGFDDLDWLPDPRITEYDGEPRTELVEGSAS